MSNVLAKSISEIEGWISWKGDVPTLDNSSYEEYQYYKLHRKPIKDYSVEDIYFMIGQAVCLSISVPLALDMLLKDKFIKADDYESDLLIRILQLPSDFFYQNDKVKAKLLALINSIEEQEVNKIKFSGKSKKKLMTLIDHFKSLSES